MSVCHSSALGSNILFRSLKVPAYMYLSPATPLTKEQIFKRTKPSLFLNHDARCFTHASLEGSTVSRIPRVPWKRIWRGRGTYEHLLIHVSEPSRKKVSGQGVLFTSLEQIQLCSNSKSHRQIATFDRSGRMISSLPRDGLCRWAVETNRVALLRETSR